MEPPTVNKQIEGITKQLEQGFAKLNVGMDRNLETMDECIATMDKLLSTYKPPVMKRIHPMSLSMTKHPDGHWNVCVKGTYGFYFGCPDKGTRVRILERCCQAFDRLPTSDVYYISTCDTAYSGIDPREMRDSLNGYLQEI